MSNQEHRGSGVRSMTCTVHFKDGRQPVVLGFTNYDDVDQSYDMAKVLQVFRAFSRCQENLIVESENE